MNNNAHVYALPAAISTVGIDRAPPGAKKESLSLFSAGENLQPDAELEAPHRPHSPFISYRRSNRVRYHITDATVSDIISPKRPYEILYRRSNRVGRRDLRERRSTTARNL